MKRRKLNNWLKGLLEYVEDTEAPRLYWLWSGLFTISSALQRKVWINYGIENIYPNLYVCIVARPGEKKGAPIGFAKKILEQLQIPVAVDSTSKRALTKELVKSSETQVFKHPDGKPYRMSCLAIPSKELGSLLAIDKENMIIALTDLFDCHDIWKYNTSDKGNDHLPNVCCSFFAATTPRYIANNLPPEAFAEGFASRVAWVSERPMYKPVDWPAKLDPILYKNLLHDLHTINQLVGEFQVDPVARAVFKQWYDKIPERKRTIKDERLYGNLNRLHIIVLKTAMCLQVAESDELILPPDIVGRSIDLIEEIFSTTAQAFGGSGYGQLGPFVDQVRSQVNILGETTMKELMQMNYRNLSESQLKEVLSMLTTMGDVEMPLETKGSLDQVIRRIKKRRKE